ncbi:unnamed protein product [Didymodactylos carnosus]|uniref:Uncharacterized protein n=1 Tax=Didymodactylos carnosus TaxID=1234261 RepID=A0A815DQH4_9BILA|nr:unnamed protein product [Didymodactylos carnosus]CAF1315643.1 unnamed protein product [Didymodactylos carnosus]CAF4122010.1 unnamed protein product [Didymodactylos carnosus]CAF4124431.1 unnamed protein product [Didymodactylos carnosus]
MALKENKIKYCDFVTTIGVGTFARVILVHYRTKNEYYALKMMSIEEIVRLKQTEHVKNERKILAHIKHPFIVNFYWSDRDIRDLYLLLEYVPGGELFSYLRKSIRFNTDIAKFYTCEIILALEYLHSFSIAYRDIKPENLLLDSSGHLKLTDFGFAKYIHDRTYSTVGTPEYLAPEIILSNGHSTAVDWYSLGILIYEFLVGQPPFIDDNPFHIYQKILQENAKFPAKYVDPVAKHLIKKLIIHDRTKRLGNMKNGANDVKNHRWFKNVNWEYVYDRRLQPPIIPSVLHSGDTQNFEQFDDCDVWYMSPISSIEDFVLFADF